MGQGSRKFEYDFRSSHRRQVLAVYIRQIEQRMRDPLEFDGAKRAQSRNAVRVESPQFLRMAFGSR